MLFCCAAFFLHFFRFFLLLAYAFWPIFALLLPYCCPMLAFLFPLSVFSGAARSLGAGTRPGWASRGLWDWLGAERLKQALQKPALQNRVFRCRRFEARRSEAGVQKPILQDIFVLQKSF